MILIMKIGVNDMMDMKREMKNMSYKIELIDMFDKVYKFYWMKLKSANVLKMKYSTKVV